MSKLCVFVLFHLSLTTLFLSTSSSDLFDAWCRQHGKTYPSEGERQYRIRVFDDNLAFISQHNELGNSSYTLSLNAFADLTHYEFKTSLLGLAPPPDGFGRRAGLVPRVSADGPVPDEVDWRKSGAVTKVKDQASCGACWSFSATGAIEGINKIFTGSLVSLSEQELIDCDRTYNSGCGGGLMDYAYQFVIENHGIDTEVDYPYEGKQKTCNKEKLKKHVVTIDGYTDVPSNNEKALLKAVATQPVSVGICGSERAFQLYSKGIFSGPCSNDLDHAVLIVGYGSENGVDYWIVKNSWGPHWGISGYIHMQRNTGSVNGICGINMLASYPTKTSPNPPAPPHPSPTKCDLFSSCPEGSTCCCTWSVLGLCLRWKCCQLDSAVCCNDGAHCCPRDYPICDTKRNACLKGNGNFTSFKDLEKKQDSYRTFRGWNPLLEALNL